MIIAQNQRRLDPGMAPVEACCPCCGGEIYSREALRRNRGLCPDCDHARRLAGALQEEEAHGA